jgi:serine/threonine protein kinase
MPPGASPVDAIAPGTRLREWEIVRFVGRGSYGVVFEARRSSWLDEPARALKIFDPIISSAARSALLGEFSTLTGVRHPHLLAGVDAFDLVEPPFAGCVVFVLELADEDLAHRVARSGALAPGAAATVMADVADGLAALHARGRIHGDVKPENILRVDERWALGDFGVTSVLEGSYAVTRGATIDYRPPELAQAGEGDLQHRSADIWALGVALHVAATGRHPFPGPDPMMRYAAAVRGDRATVPALDPALAAVIDEGCLVADPRCRLDATQLAARLRALATPTPSALPADPAAPAAPAAPSSAPSMLPAPSVLPGDPAALAPSAFPGDPAAPAPTAAPVAPSVPPQPPPPAPTPDAASIPPRADRAPAPVPASPVAPGPGPQAATTTGRRWLAPAVAAVATFVLTQVVAVACGEALDEVSARRVAYVAVSLVALAAGVGWWARRHGGYRAQGGTGSQGGQDGQGPGVAGVAAASLAVWVLSTVVLFA